MSQENVMGRKGIGKLAALYLSDDYDIVTKSKDGGTLCWNLHYDQQAADTDSEEETSKPQLLPKAVPPELHIPNWDSVESGTVLQLRGVNLNHIRTAGYERLSVRLANQFLRGVGNSTSIQLAVVENDETPEFKEVEKEVATGNFAFITTDAEEQGSLIDSALRKEMKNIQTSYMRNRVFSENEGTEAGQRKIEEQVATEPSGADTRQVSIKKVLIPYRKGELNTSYWHIPTFKAFKSVSSGLSSAVSPTGMIHFEPRELVPSTEVADRAVDAKKGKDINYRLSGWIAIHATIKPAAAQTNDERFKKNNYYNPNSLRLYVRGKLADENLLPKLGITQAFLNYVEGEISFDILDNDDLPDIATSSRQGFDEHDKRWEKLISIVRPIVRDLIQQRQELADTQRSLATNMRNQIEANANAEAVRTVAKEISTDESIPQQSKEHVVDIVQRQLKGEKKVTSKEEYAVFLSHATRDKRLADFIYYVLLEKGATDNEIFYTNEPYADDLAIPGDEAERQRETLEDLIRQNIVSKNTMVVFVTSPNFYDSQYTMFEAGAGWATRSVTDYESITIRFSDIPKYLNHGEYRTGFSSDDDSISLANYSVIVELLNLVIEHINRGRGIQGREPVRSISSLPKLTPLELKEQHKTQRDFWDSDVLKIWENYVEQGLDNGDTKLSVYENQIRQTRDEHDTRNAKLSDIYKRS